MNDLKYYFDVWVLPVVDDEPDIPEVYYVMTGSDSIIAAFDNYNDAVDLICLIEDFCISRNLDRKEVEI